MQSVTRKSAKGGIKRLKQEELLSGSSMHSKQVRSVAEAADGVVVGSALVNCIPRNLESPERIPAEIGEKARELAQGISPLEG